MGASEILHGTVIRRMNRVAVFGNAGAGKSTLAVRLAELTGIPLYPLDMIQFREGRYWPEEKDGGKRAPEEYLKIHADLLKRDRWIVDGYDSAALTWQRFDAADTLVYVDLPVLTHYRWVTKRLLKGLFRNPRGLAGEQPGVEQHTGQLPGGLALSSTLGAEISTARRCRGISLAGSPLEVISRNPLLPRSGQERAAVTAQRRCRARCRQRLSSSRAGRGTGRQSRSSAGFCRPPDRSCCR